MRVWNFKVNKLSQEHLRKIFDYDRDSGILRWRIKPARRVSIGDEAGTLGSDGYRRVVIDSIQYLTHHVIWIWLHGEPIPDGFEIDHENGIPKDNRKDNLRRVTKSQQQMNHKLHKNSSTGFKGVHWESQTHKYRVSIGLGNKSIKLGRFSDFDEACRVRKEAEKLYHKGFNRET